MNLLCATKETGSVNMCIIIFQKYFQGIFFILNTLPSYLNNAAFHTEP